MKQINTDYEKADQADWTAYRKALRDVTKQPGFPATVEWPTVPGAKIIQPLEAVLV
jgi:hypothetical protein